MIVTKRKGMIKRNEVMIKRNEVIILFFQHIIRINEK